MQDCSNSIANPLELLQSCTKLSKYFALIFLLPPSDIFPPLPNPNIFLNLTMYGHILDTIPHCMNASMICMIITPVAPFTNMV